jgi:toxin YoeB
LNIECKRIDKKKKQADESLATTLVQIIRLSPGFTTKFKEDLVWWYKNDDKKATKILDLITVLMSNHFTGISKPEPLKYMEGNFRVRRIDLEHRLVYVVNNEQIVFFSCRYHYE